MKIRGFFKYRSMRDLPYLVIAALIIILPAFKFVGFASAYNQENYYLNLDILDLNAQNVLFDINEVKVDLNKINGTINISLNYNAESSYDSDNDGKEKLNGVIDFSVGNTAFNWNVDKSKLCTRWEIYSIDHNRLNAICYGNEGCCKFISLASSRSNWNEALYFAYGMHDASESNVVGAQVIYVDYNLSAEKPYSNIYYSKWESLPALFKEDSNSIKNISIVDALKNIEKIRNKNNKIRKIELKDEDGNELKEIRPNENISIAVNISETIVSINNFNALNADWGNSDAINITTENKKLAEALKGIGITAKTIVSIKGMDNFLDGENYDGSVKLPAADYFNSIIYCSDDKVSSCHFVQECANEFKGSECYIKNGSMLTVYVPHFSSIIVALGNTNLNLTINSPDNSTTLDSGEGIYLNFTINESANANYSLDSQSFVALNSGTSFSALLNGTLPYGVLANGLHNLSIYVRGALGDSAIVNHLFIVNDTDAPNISINITNNSIFSGASLLLPVKINSEEYANISHKINDDDFSSFIDLGAGKSKIMNLIPESGSNNLIINATDLHYNSNLLYLLFNFTLVHSPSCSDAMQNGDETGIDCGGSCSNCINFTIFANKPSYNLTENVYITVIARANSTVNATVLRQNTVTSRHNFIPVFAAPIAEIRLIENTSNAGNYTINATMFYLNITENRNFTFEVLAPSSNPISATINANATIINEGGAISFTSTITGNATAVAYKWDFQNDGSIDSTIAAPAYAYPSNGTFTVNLTVSDSNWNQTDIESIKVRKLYNITILARDNATSNPIENAEVELENEFKNTSADGTASYAIPPEMYRLIVKKPGYAAFSNRTEVSGNAIFEVKLFQEDKSSPAIHLISPEDRIAISNASAALKYKAFDSSSMTCSLYININSTSWKLDGINSNVISNEDSSFVLTNLKNNTYQWKIECIDKNNNSNFSETYTFTVDTSLVENMLSVDMNEQDKSAENIISQIDAIMDSLDRLSADEKDAAEAMQSRKKLEKAKIAIQRANRDLHSLKWRRLNQTELEQETQAVLGRIENVKDTTPKGIEVIDKNEFVKYPNKEDVGRALEVLINTTNLKFTRKEFNNLVQENYKLQSAMTVTTKARLINVDYISGDKQTVTLIQKIINSEKNNGKKPDNPAFFEVIPKDIAKNLSEMELLFDYEIIDNDPIVSMDANKIKEFSYILNKRASISDTEKLKSILLDKNLKPSDKGGGLITGFVPLGKISSGFVKTADLRLIAEFAVIVVLVIIFSYYQFGGSDKIAYLFNKELNEINELISSALNDLKNNDYGSAALKYKEINPMFNKLEKRKKDMLKESVVELINKINLLYIYQLSEKANACIITNNREDAYAIYLKIQSLYKIIPKNYKAEVSKKCLELHSKLNVK